MLEGDDPLDIVQNFGESWVIYRYAGYRDLSVDEAQNAYGRMLQLAVLEDSIKREVWGKVPEYRLPNTTGSLLVVDRTKKDLDVRKVKAICGLIEERAVPLLTLEHQLGRMAVLNALTQETLEGYTVGAKSLGPCARAHHQHNSPPQL